ncbi:MAG: dihydrolipoyl dehydrogenase [Bacteroidales bacterium]|nr:dihydrolipoyl dehydrogenase [Bacteroidales bacterium]
MYDIVVIGSGPGGYVAAIRASQLGFKTAVVEKAELGGVCLNWGCIPTKALLKSAQVYENIKKAKEFGIHVDNYSVNYNDVIKRSRNIAQTMSKGIEYLFRKNKVDIIRGTAKLTDENQVIVRNIEKDEETQLKSKHIIIATGSRAKDLPNLQVDSKYVISYREALSSTELPKRILIVGAGAIGCEFAYFYNTMGSQVTLVEYMPEILPMADIEISKSLERSFKRNNINVFTSSFVKGYRIENNKIIVEIQTDQEVKILEVDKILLAVGVTSNIENLGLDELKIKTQNNKIIVNEHYETNVKNIYAIGDVINTPALAHVASAEGIYCVEYLAGKKPKSINYNAIPWCVYTNPEVSCVGLTEKQATESNYNIKVGKFPFTASGKAKAVGNYDGFVKVILNTHTNEILGVHAIGYNVTEIIAEATLAINNNINIHSLIKSIHPHPTISEALMEAAAHANNEAIHL